MDYEPCACCIKFGSYTCKVCESITYCSATCAADDRSMHRGFCSIYSKFIENNPRPAETSSTLYLLAAHIRRRYTTPEFFWRKLEKKNLEKNMIFNQLEDRRLKNSATISIDLPCCNSSCRVEHTIVMHWLEDCMSKDNLAERGNNKCVSLLLNDDNHSWRGPFVALGQTLSNVKDSSNLMPFYSDIQMLDMHIISEFFRKDAKQWMAQQSTDGSGNAKGIDEQEVGIGGSS